MDKVNFSDGLHPQSADLNSLGTFTEGGFDALLRAISTSDSGQILFDLLTPVAALVSGNLEISVPAQRFAVAGAVQLTELAATAPDASTDLWVAVYLVAGKTPDNQPRDFTSVDPTTGLIVQQQLTTEIYRRDDPSVAFSVSTDLGITPTEPLLDELALGQVKLADIKFTQSTSGIVITLNSAAQYVLPPGATGGATAHAASHQDGGSDPLPLAIVTGSASSIGMMPTDSQYKVEQSIQSVTPATGVDYINVTTDAARLVTLDINLADSLDAVDVDGTTSLGVNLRPKNAVNGQEDRAARADHRHSALASGVLVQKTVLDVTALLNSTTTVTFAAQTQGTQTVNPGQITNVALFWLPGDQVDPTAPRGVGCGWQLIWEAGANRSVGARAYIINANTFQVEVGELGATVLTPPALAAVQSGTWTSPSYAGGTFPTSGQLQIIATAITTG